MSQWVPKVDVIDGDEESGAPKFTGREGTIYLIDAAIFANTENDRGQFLECLGCIEEDLLKNMLVNARDMVSVVFYNTLHSPPASTQLTQGVEDTTIIPANCAVFIPLKPLSKDLIQCFKNFRASSDFFDFGTAYGVSNGSCFSEALWLCSRLIIRCNYKLINSKVVLFTNNPLPHEPGTPEQQQAFVRAKDLYDNNIFVDVVPMVDVFDLEPFYKEFLSAVEGIEPEQYECDNPADKRFLLLNRMYRPNYQKSCVRHINFELVKGITMACDIHSFTRTANKPNSVKINRENREVAIGKRANVVAGSSSRNENRDVDEDGNEQVPEPRQLLPSEVFKSQNICGKTILFKADEVVAMKSIQETGLRLLGFKPLDQLKPRWMVKHCQFIYPNEKRINGSTTLFRALWQKCLEKQKYALCTITMRRNAAPEYVALVPQTAEGHENDDADIPRSDGFNIIYLPVETNIGALDSLVSPLPEPTPEQVDLFDKLCKKLKFKDGTFRVGTYANPMLHSFYTNFEALVYDEEAKEMEDFTLPDTERIDSKVEPLLQQIVDEFGEEDSASGRKRTNDGEAGGSRAKASKKDLTPNDVEEAIRNGRAQAVTIPQLKEFIQKKKAHPPTGAVKQRLFEFAQALID